MFTVKPLTGVQKDILIPADKSISHRAVMISSICRSETEIKPFLRSEDTLATLGCIKKLGVKVRLNRDKLVIKGSGLYFPGKKKVTLYAHESGTTIRILSGLLCAQKFPCEFTAAPSLNLRPMGRIVRPLREMNADIKGVAKGDNIYPPLYINPSSMIQGGSFKLDIASAQVKSAIIFAALYARGKTVISQPYMSRDHTERMLGLFQAKIEKKGRTIIAYPVKQLISPGELFIPSDFSSAAYFIVLGLILKNSEFIIRDVNLNPTRCGLIAVLKRMGANLKIVNKKSAYEPYGDIIIKSSQLYSTKVLPQEIPLMIDEIPLLCVAAAFARGKTVISGVKELKVKETDRIESMIFNFKKAGVDIFAQEINEQNMVDWQIVINGAKTYRSCEFKSFGDHRTAMSMIVFSAAYGESSILDDVQCINKSFPEFLSRFKSLYQ